MITVQELHMLLEEAYNYKTKKDKNGLSGAFKVCTIELCVCVGILFS